MSAPLAPGVLGGLVPGIPSPPTTISKVEPSEGWIWPHEVLVLDGAR